MDRILEEVESTFAVECAVGDIHTWAVLEACFVKPASDQENPLVGIPAFHVAGSFFGVMDVRNSWWCASDLRYVGPCDAGSGSC